MKKEMNLEITLDELDELFFIKNYILADGFVPLHLSRHICRRIADTFFSWLNFLHEIIMPNPQSLIYMGQSKVFDKEEKKKVTDLIKKIMEISERNSLAGLTKSKEIEKEFIMDALAFWNNELKIELIKIKEKLKEEWKHESENYEN